MSLIFLLLVSQGAQPPPPQLWQRVLESLEQSGRAAEVIQTTAERLQPPRFAPGAPPLLSFRYFEGRRRHRFGELGLVMDDAAH